MNLGRSYLNIELGGSSNKWDFDIKRNVKFGPNNENYRLNKYLESRGSIENFRYTMQNFKNNDQKEIGKGLGFEDLYKFQKM